VEEKDDYPANFERVSGLIRQLWELRPVQEFKVGPSQFGRLELVEPGQGDSAGTLVELKDKDAKNLAKIIVGKRNMRKSDDFPGGRFGGFPVGAYVMAPKSGRVGLVSQNMQTEANPTLWLKHDFIKIDKPSSITLSGQNGPRHWTLMRPDEKADWKLADAKPNEEINRETISTLTSVLASPSFTDVLPGDAKPQEHGLDKPEVVTIETFDRFTYTLNVGKLSGENYPVTVSVAADPAKERTPPPDEKAEDKPKRDEEFKTQLKKLEDKAAAEKEYGKRIYLLAKFSIDPILKDRADLLAKKTPPPSPAKKR
jgi:hypothetical protein